MSRVLQEIVLKSLNLKIIISMALSFTLTANVLADDRSLVSINAQGYGLYIKGNYNSAFTVYKKGLSLYPNSAALYDGIGAVYLKKKNFHQAYQSFNTASQLDTNNSLYKIHAQEAIYKSHINKLNLARQLTSTAFTFAPNNPVIRKNFENIRENKIKSLGMIYYVCQNPRDINLSKGNEAFWKKDFKKAEQLYQKSIKSKHRNYEALNNLGLVYLETASLNNAIDCFKKAANLNPSLAQAYNNLGVVYCKYNNYTEATKNFDMAIKRGENYFPAYNNKAVNLINSIFEHIDASMQCLETIVKLEPNNILAKQSYGLFLSLDENYSSAINVYKSGLNLTQDNFNFIKQYADNLYVAGQYQEAINYYKKAASINNDNSDIFVSLARALEKNGESQEAFTSYQTALRANARNSSAYRNFGLFLLNQKRKSEAKGILSKYVTLAPYNYDTPYIKRLIQYL